jgi:cytoskeletal protein CcmA (bactofilin family)
MPSLRRLATILVAAAPVALTALPAWAAVSGEVAPDQIVLSGRADVPRGRTVGQVVVFRGVASIQGVAHGDVVVFSGRVSVAGQVSGNVVALDGTVVLAPTAQVRGDVISRGAVVVRQGAQVQGEIRENVPLSIRGPVEIFGPLATWLAVSVSGLVLGLVLLWVAPRASESVVATGRRAPWASAGWGIGLLVGLPVITLGLALTLVGLPLALVLVLAIGLALFVGYAWAAWILGRALLPPPRGRIVAFLAGFAILRLVGAVPVAGGVTWLLASAFGLGAAVVAMWGARGVGGKHRAGRPAAEASAWDPTGDEASPAPASSKVVAGSGSVETERSARDEVVDPKLPGAVPDDGVDVAEPDEDWMPLVRAEPAPEVDAVAEDDRPTPAPSSGRAPGTES